jgi:protein gp37
MGDLFGDWVPAEWIGTIQHKAYVIPHHTFQFLTKNPERYQEFNPWPENCWLGATITNQADADARVPKLLKAEAAVKFVSIEPMLGPVDLKFWIDTYSKPRIMTAGESYLSWLIVGARTGPGAKNHQPKHEWVQSLIDQARAAKAPIFLKPNLHWPEKIQEWP